ncbi:MAG: hypothetical protein ABJD68_11685 [Nakamurella sp.]
MTTVSGSDVDVDVDVDVGVDADVDVDVGVDVRVDRRGIRRIQHGHPQAVLDGVTRGIVRWAVGLDAPDDPHPRVRRVDHDAIGG